MTRAVALAAAAAAVAAASLFAGRPLAVDVPPGVPISRVVRALPDDAVVRLLPGRHGTFELNRPVTVEGTPGSVVAGPITVKANGVRLASLVVRGGESGITVAGADGVTIEGVSVAGAEAHGIEVVDGSAHIARCEVGRLASAYAQGIEVRNSNGRPRTLVEECRVASGQEGLVSHVSRVVFRRNIVSGTALRGITVTEMSEGLVEENEVAAVRGAGVYCGDMSHCEVAGNRVRGVRPAMSGARSAAGYGAVAFYYSTMRLRDNSFSDLATPQPVSVGLGSVLTSRFPLSIWPQGWAGIVPGVFFAVGAALLGLTLARAGVPLILRPRRRHAESLGESAPQLSRRAFAVLLMGFVVQSFHMVEHAVQVYQVYVADAEHRSGFAGAHVDMEWLHFAYNAAVLLFLIWAWRSLSEGGRTVPGGGFLLATMVIQGYHLVEHTAKVVQHAITGIDPAPGLVGGRLGLVWFHFSINLAVYLGTAVPLTSVFAARLREGSVHRTWGRLQPASGLP